MNASNNQVTATFVAFGVFLVCVAARAETGANNVTTIAVPAGGRPVTAKVDSQGTIHLLYDSPGGPHYVRSLDNGQTLGQPIEIVDRQARKPGLEFQAWDLAVGKAGRVHVAMSTNAWKLKLPQEEWALFYARLDPGAHSFSPAQNLNRQPSEGFSLAADELGNVTACWLSGKLYATVSHDNGASFQPTVEINPEFNPCDCCTTSCAYGADGRLALIYREEGNDDRDMFLVLWDQNQNQTSRTRISTTLWHIDACPMTYYQIAATPRGYVAVWPTKGEVHFARLNTQGVLLPPGEIKTPGTTGMRTGLLALTNSGGTTLVAWKKDGLLGWQLYDQQGRASGKTGSIKSAGNGAAGAVAKDGRFVLFQ